MFTTIGGYFLFIIPSTILLALGIIFEDKLVEFEDVLKWYIKQAIANKFKLKGSERA